MLLYFWFLKRTNMNLIVDIGNTLAKVAVFQQNVVLDKWVGNKQELSKKIQDFFSQFPRIPGVIISKVAEADIHLPPQLEKNAVIINLGPETTLPFENLYATPKTLGNDRKALVAAAVKEYPGKNVLVIDAGTCITYDFKNSRDQYLGGAISPGLKMRFQALNNFTANLPLVEFRKDVSYLGNSTLTSINAGVEVGVLHEVNGFIREYSEKFEDLVVIITGGDAQFLSINLKNSIFANSNFLLEGLNQILEFNISQ